MPPARRTETPAARDPGRSAPGWFSRRAAVALVAASVGLFHPVRFAAAEPASPAASESRAEPIAGAFVYPVGDELDFTKAHEGEPSGFTISDSYLVVRDGKHGQRTHKGVDLSCGRGGSPVRAVASGVVVVADARALIRDRQAKNVKTTKVVHGKPVVRWVTRYRTTTRWRTGWGNYVVIRHTLPSGETVHSLYGHLQSGSIQVRQGDVVAAGEMIARVGSTGRATSPHLHIEIRTAVPNPAAGDDFNPDEAENSTVLDRTFALLATVDPVAFLEHHVRRFEDLDPRAWESRYALAACRDGVMTGDKDRFEPDESITRGDFEAALASTFGSRSAFGPIPESRMSGRAGDHLTRSEALELLLRCLDKAPARGKNLESFQRAALCSDFNRVFAGEEAALRADREARAAAVAETASRRKAADATYAKALRASKAAPGKARRSRVKRETVKPVLPATRLDPGLEAIARSDRNLTRAEACLLLASSFRLGRDRTSALEQAAARVSITAPSEASSR